MKSKKFLTCLLVFMMIVSLSGISAFAEETPAVEEPAAEEPAVEEPAVEEPAAEEPAVEEPAAEEPAAEEPVQSYIRLDLDGDVILIVEDGVVVGVTNELDLYPEEPAAEEPAVEEPAVEEPEPVDPYAEYLGLSPEDAVNLLIEGQEGPVSLDIFANGEDAAALKELIEGMDEELLQVKTIILDSDNPNADRFINAAIYRITPGKMNLLEKLNAMSEDDIDFALYATMEVKDIQGEVNAKRAETKTAEKNGPTKKVKTNNGKAVGKSK